MRLIASASSIHFHRYWNMKKVHKIQGIIFKYVGVYCTGKVKYGEECEPHLIARLSRWRRVFTRERPAAYPREIKFSDTHAVSTLARAASYKSLWEFFPHNGSKSYHYYIQEHVHAFTMYTFTYNTIPRNINSLKSICYKTRPCIFIYLRFKKLSDSRSISRISWIFN